MTTNSTQFRYARIGSISHGTLRTEDLLSTFSSELEGLVLLNGAWFSLPENFNARDRLNSLVGEAQDAWAEDGETLADEEQAQYTLESLFDALNEFAPAYCNFGANEGDGSDFGFWPDLEGAKECVDFVSWKSHQAARSAGVETDPDDPAFPPSDFRGEWLHVSDHGNVTLYVRDEAGKDVEVWSIG